MHTHIDRIVLAGAKSCVSDVTRSGEELAVLVKRARHDTVGRVKGLFHAIAMVNVNVDVPARR